MPKKVIPHDHGKTPIEGFEWDGIRLSEFAQWFRSDFCYAFDESDLVIAGTHVHVGDWIINEDNHFVIVDDEEFEREFDLVEGH